MKNLKIQILIKVFSLLMLSLVLLSGCQEEFSVIDEPDDGETISAGADLADLIRRVTLKDGSFDNIIDKCSEISIQFPYSVHVKGERINITSLDDIKALTLDYFHFRNAININYPVTILYSDYSQAVLSHAGELRQIQDQCNTTLIDEDIECFDFIYPVNIDLYNTEFQNHDFIIAKNDRDLYNIFNDINDFIVEINYPVHVRTSDGDTLNINDNIELENEITRVIDACDENDEVEFDDEDYPGFYMLTSGTWKITHFADTTDETSSFRSFHLTFNQDFTIEAFTDSETLTGEWEIDLDDDIRIIEIEFDTDEEPLVWLNDEWEIIELNENTLVMQAESEAEGFVKQLTLIKSESVNHR